MNVARKQYIPRKDVLKAMDETADPQFKLMIALSRFGGLRCPSEHLALRWQNVDFDRGHITVSSPKTEHHEGGAERTIPMFPELKLLLLQAFTDAEPGSEYVISSWRSTATNLRTQFTRIIRRAGLKPWPKLWHNLRASCETDLAREYPLVTVAAWLGHNPAVMVTNYLTNPDLDADFQRAAAGGPNEATRNPTRQGGGNGGNWRESGNDDRFINPNKHGVF